MDCIDRLIEYGFDFNVSDSGSIGVKFTGSLPPGKEITAPLFSEIRERREEAISYVNRIITSVFDISSPTLYPDIAALMDYSPGRFRWLRADIHRDSGRLVITGVCIPED